MQLHSKHICSVCSFTYICYYTHLRIKLAPEYTISRLNNSKVSQRGGQTSRWQCRRTSGLRAPKCGALKYFSARNSHTEKAFGVLFLYKSALKANFIYSLRPIYSTLQNAIQQNVSQLKQHSLGVGPIG